MDKEQNKQRKSQKIHGSKKHVDTNLKRGRKNEGGENSVEFEDTPPATQMEGGGERKYFGHNN